MRQNHVTPLELALELKRLASGVVRDVQRDADLTCLSHLAAIKPLAQLLSEVLSPQEVLTKSNENSSETSKNPIGFSAPCPVEASK